jgi:hypothetical protein
MLSLAAFHQAPAPSEDVRLNDNHRISVTLPSAVVQATVTLAVMRLGAVVYEAASHRWRNERAK